MTISRLVQRLKGKTAYKLLQGFAHIREEFRGRHVWARGHFCRSGGDVTDGVVARYIEEQGVGHDGDFRVEGAVKTSAGRGPVAFSRALLGIGLESVTPKPPP